MLRQFLRAQLDILDEPTPGHKCENAANRVKGIYLRMLLAVNLGASEKLSFNFFFDFGLQKI